MVRMKSYIVSEEEIVSENEVDGQALNTACYLKA